jgi:transposase-like protein
MRAALHPSLELSVLGVRFPDDIIALAVRWYVRYRLSCAEVSE